MKRKYEKKGPPDKAGLRELLAKDGRDYLLRWSTSSRWREARWIRSST